MLTDKQKQFLRRYLVILLGSLLVAALYRDQITVFQLTLMLLVMTAIVSMSLVFIRAGAELSGTRQRSMATSVIGNTVENIVEKAEGNRRTRNITDLIEERRHNRLHQNSPWLIFSTFVVLLFLTALAYYLETMTQHYLFFLLLCMVFILVRGKAFILTEEGQTKSAYISKLSVQGYISVIIFIITGALVLYCHIPGTAPDKLKVEALYALASSGLALAFYKLRATRLVENFNVFMGLLIPPIIAAWVIASLSWAGFIATTMANDYLYADGINEQRVRDDRKESIPKYAAPVAVTLSGGGYRAATVHAGVLSVLDDAGVPIYYLSTVSGGTIIGASYALGQSPETFAKRLAHSKPALSNDLFNIFAVAADLILPLWVTTDTFDLHLRRVFYQGRRFTETGPPNLIINATSYDDGRPASFIRDLNGSRRLGTLVAASAAFPGPFKPISIDGKSYIDGGVVDNLGLLGLHQYLETTSKSPKPTPRLLIISTVSKAPRATNGIVYKPFGFEVLNRAIDLTYESLHSRIFEKFTGSQYVRGSTEPLDQPFKVEASVLCPVRGEEKVAVFVLDPTAEPEHSRFNNEDVSVIEKVGNIPTLKELDREEVKAAFWAGRAITIKYLSRICEAARVKCRDLPEESWHDFSVARNW
jgi:predicted acylesterase/phospholipase RssA